MNSKLIKIIVSMALPFIAGAIGSYFTIPATSSWYEGLTKPFFTPPDSIFGPVWVVLYILMGISFYLVWSKRPIKANKKIRIEGIRLFIVQLVLNVLWSIIFFGYYNPFLALAEIIVLAAMIYLTIRYFYKVSKIAAYLLYPYLAWVLFAIVLDLSIVLLN